MQDNFLGRRRLIQKTAKFVIANTLLYALGVIDNKSGFGFVAGAKCTYSGNTYPDGAMWGCPDCGPPRNPSFTYFCECNGSSVSRRFDGSCR